MQLRHDCNLVSFISIVNIGTCLTSVCMFNKIKLFNLHSFLVDIKSHWLHLNSNISLVRVTQLVGSLFVKTYLKSSCRSKFKIATTRGISTFFFHLRISCYKSSSKCKSCPMHKYHHPYYMFFSRICMIHKSLGIK